MEKVIFVSLVIIIIFSSYAQDSTIPGEIYIPYPTIKNIAIEWLIEGDINLNGIVLVHYRKKGESEWKEAMPLRRVPAGENLGFTWKNKFSGSIFNLAPGVQNMKLNLILLIQMVETLKK